MRKSWTLYKLEQKQVDVEEPSHLSEGKLNFMELPYYASTNSELPPETVRVANVYHDYDHARLALLAGIDWATWMGADIYQISLELIKSRYGDEDPLNSSIRELAANRKIFVVAAGNSGDNIGTLSDLATIPGVISVGATTKNGELLNSSSRGTEHGVTPTIACDGTDPFPEPFPPGTSFAAGYVADVCAFIQPILGFLIKEFSMVRAGVELPARPPASSCLALLDTSVSEEEIEQRKTRARLSAFHRNNVVLALAAHRKKWIESVISVLPVAEMNFEFGTGHNTIRKVLVATADEVLCDDPLGCGAGFFSVEVLRQQLLDFTPSRFQKWFGENSVLTDAQKDILELLDRELGALWSKDLVDYFWQEYMTLPRKIFATVIK